MEDGKKPFDPGLEVIPTENPLGFRYGAGCFGPEPEIRRLDSIRASLMDPGCDGPEEVYAIAMDVGRAEHRQALESRMLLYGVVTYARGRLGREPIRSQGHVHRVSPHCGWSTPEVYEIWRGRAVIYMQERAEDSPGRCFAVEAGPDDVVIVPPGWAHATVSADPASPLTFGAFCDRQYGFEYAGVRAHGGLAWFPVLDEEGGLLWEHNPRYAYSPLLQKAPRFYGELGLQQGVSLYAQFAQEPDRFLFVSEPVRRRETWRGFTP